MAKQWTKYGIGIDVGKNKLHACISGVEENGGIKVIAQKSFSNTPSGYEKLYSWLEQKRKVKSLSWQIVLEVTGVYHESVVHYMYEKGCPVCVELAKRVNRYLESIGQYSKTDKLDGKGLSRLACERKLKLWSPVSAHIYEIRSLLRHRKALLLDKNQFVNQRHALQHGQTKIKQVQTSLNKLIEELEAQVKAIEEQVKEVARKEASFYSQVEQIVESVKGLGLLSVLTILSETNGFKTIESVRQLVSYAGYDVVEKQSGQSRSQGRISKRGNAHIRASLYMPALCVIRQKVNPFYDFYIRLLKRNGGIKKKANVAVQRKLLVLVYTLWKKKEGFIENYEQVRLKKQVAPSCG